MKLIATLNPRTSIRNEIAAHPLVDELRFNSITDPQGKSGEEMLEILLGLAQGKKLWVDLKTRQLRIIRWADPTYAYVQLSHSIHVKLPCPILFKDCVSTIIDIIDGYKLVLEDPPDGPVGEGEPVNILDPTLEIEGFLTERDKAYLAAAVNLGVHSYMLSFVEKDEDIAVVRDLDPLAEIVAKIESMKGLDFVRNGYPQAGGGLLSLMAARDDLFINIRRKFEILAAERLIVEADPQAIAASRILTSLEDKETVSLGDIHDLFILYQLGYRNFMLSDRLCKSKAAFSKAMGIWAEFSEFVEKRGGQG